MKRAQRRSSVSFPTCHFDQKKAPTHGRRFFIRFARFAVALLLDFQQLDVEDEHAVRSARIGLVAVSELAWDPEARLFALDHELHAFGPALDYARERELRRLTAHDRAIETLAVCRPARVVDLHHVRGFGVNLALALG